MRIIRIIKNLGAFEASMFLFTIATLLQLGCGDEHMPMGTEGGGPITPVYYDTDAQPIFQAYCSGCHNASNPKGDNWLDYSRAASMAGEISNRMKNKSMPIGINMPDDKREVLVRWAASGAQKSPPGGVSPQQTSQQPALAQSQQVQQSSSAQNQQPAVVEVRAPSVTIQIQSPSVKVEGETSSASAQAQTQTPSTQPALSNPLPPGPWIATPALLDKGKTLFAQNCAPCHGDQGKGDGLAAPSLNPKPRNFALDSDWKNGRQASKIYATLTNGLPPIMPSFSALSDEDRWALAHFVLTLGPANYPKDTEADLKKAGVRIP